MSFDEPFFSIVTVCLNPGTDLDKTVESVLQQSYKDFEHIIKDGGSNDGTENYANSDQRVIFISGCDDGIYDAMNQALKMCRGRYVNFLNAGDTFSTEQLLEKLAANLQKYKYPDIGCVNRFNEKTKSITYYPSTINPWFLYRGPICHQSLFINRKLIIRAGGFDTNFRIFADHNLLTKLILYHGATYHHYPLCGVNYKDDGFSSDKKNISLKNKELHVIRRSNFNKVQRAVFGALWLSSLPKVRIWLVRRKRMLWLSRVLRSIEANIMKLLNKERN